MLLKQRLQLRKLLMFPLTPFIRTTQQLQPHISGGTDFTHCCFLTPCPGPDTMSIPTHRQCTVEIQNKCSVYVLCNPHVHTVSGSCEKPLAPTLSPSESGSALYIKTPHTACGSVGVFTYDLHNMSSDTFGGRIAVMFSVPYDFNFYSNWYGIGVFGLDRQCGKQLFEQMYNNAERGFVRGKAKGPSLTHKGSSVTVRATMSDSYQPVMKVQVSDN